MMPAISIVTISFNQLEFLKECLASVRSQGFEDYEHIVLDPGSTDGSREWLEEISDANLRVIFKPDNGPAQGLNNGLSVASGDVIVYMNSDDEFAPGSLAQIAKLHRDHADADFIIGNGWTIDGKGQPLEFVKSDKFSPLRYSLRVGTVLQQATSFKRRLVDSGLRFNEANRYNWDTELLFDVADMGATVVRVPDILGYFRLHEASITMSGKYEAGLAKERSRLYARGRAKLPSGLVALLSYPARAWKKVLNVMSQSADQRSFPGLTGESRI